jgi:DNA-binding beta-propeller fold protein YncE
MGVSIFSACSDGTGPGNGGYVSQTPTLFEVDPMWPKPLPDSWVLGEVSGVATDANDHVWIVHRPHSLTDREIPAMQNPPASECCIPAPSIIEFDPDGNVLQAWRLEEKANHGMIKEHGIFVDGEGNVWMAGSDTADQVVLKFSNSGELLLQIGEWGVSGGSNDTEHLGGPTDFAVDMAENEVYISDGYMNRRIIVFDSRTGEYKRHWGAYGEVPDDSPLAAYDPGEEPAKSYRNPVHAVRLSSDSLLYMADRVNNRLQVFRKDGTFVTEKIIEKQTLWTGSVWDIEFSPDAEQTYMYITDGMNRKIRILDRATLEVIGSFGMPGRNAGLFGWVHSLAMDSKGNLYTGEVLPGKRIQKFRPVKEEE